MALIEYDIKQALAGLTDLQTKIAAPRGLLQSIGFSLLRSTRDRFDSQIDPDGRRWSPLKAATIKSKKRRKNRILENTLTLRDSIQMRVNDNSVEIGTNVVYAAIHQFGGEIERAPHTRLGLKLRKVRGKTRFAKASATKGVRTVNASVGAYKIPIPARPFLGVSKQDESEIARIVRDYLELKKGV
ncbi:MAG: phage virion morphogenesis protein [Betaproteobacteria bacterium]|nr:phage virion morphogenesis protein [Betaproteobacteria bacterium]